jgi:serine/threonine-protein kinase
MTEVLGHRSDRAGRTAMMPGMGAGPTTSVGGRRPPPERPRPGVSPHIRRRRARLAIAIILLLAVTFGAIGWWLGSGRWTVIPDLLGAEQGAAIDLLQEAGLDPDCCEEQWSEDLPEGAVISTDPVAGEAIRGTDVRLVVSKGPERFRVDTALVSQPWAEVEQKLQESLPEIAFTTVEQHDNDIPAGSVVAFDPAAGTDLKRDQVVTVIVSSGHAPVGVPDVTGQTPEQAESNLTAAGFTVTRGEDGRTAAVDVGEVMAVTPGPADGPQPFGSAVTITVSAGLPQVAVPDVIGKNLEDATATLQAAGLVVDSTRFLGNKVRAQQPAAGEVVEQGSTVKILVAP